MHFSNPAALYALLALPVILLIHFLQERSRRVRVSTLFLLEHAAPISAGGARLERLRQSLPLWLQLLAALIVTWLLAEPRWTREDSRQSIAVVLDSSASMSAFQGQTLDLALARALQPWESGARRTDWLLMESDTRRPVLYRGDSLRALLDRLPAWRPRRGGHDPTDALTLARSLVKAEGAVLWVSDRAPSLSLPAGVGLLAIGEAFDNVGFAGLTTALASDPTGETRWSVLVRNHGKQALSREWWSEWPQATGEAATSPRQRLDLAPGQTLTLSGAFPAGIDQVVLRLTPDRFALDDTLPMIRPQPRRLRAAVRLSDEGAARLFNELLTALDHVDLAQDSGGEEFDLVVSEIGEATSSHAVQFSGAGAGSVTALDPAPVLAESHALTRDLDWAGLLTPAATPLSLTPEDEPLLWKDGQPLALVRTDEQEEGRRTRRLLLAWNPAESSAARNPAVLVLLHRFVEQLRAQKRALLADNFETGQAVSLAFPAQSERSLEVGGQTQPFRQRAPEEPGFFTVREGDETLVAGGVHFADTSEADFSHAESKDDTASLRRASALKQTEADPYTPLWLIALLGCLLVSWRRSN